MPDGFVLDAYADPQRREMVLWLKHEKGGGATRLAEPFAPEAFARSRSIEKLRELARALEVLKGVGETQLDERVCGLDRAPSHVLRIPVLDYALLQKLPQMIDARGKFSDFELFNADLRMSHRYFLASGLWPLAKVRAWKAGRYRLLDPGRWSHAYEMPDLRVLEIGANARVERGELPTNEARLARAWLAETTEDTEDTERRDTSAPASSARSVVPSPSERRIVYESADEASILEWLAAEVRDRDPDVILTNGGDTFLLPYLHARAQACGVDFFLGRERDPTRPRKQGKSYFSYGKIKYQAPAYALHGRVHIDKTTSFFHEESGMHGIIDLARVSNVPMQDIARLGAGTALTAIQIDLAAGQGRLIPWKKNVPESWKSAHDLLLADRGGYIYEPRVGLHEDVVEYDFASLYPNIMVNHNISPESINCACCSLDSVPQHLATPQLGSWTCAKGEAFIPQYLRPIVARREHYKKMRKVDPARRELYQQICDAYKWLLVCSFGYQGYKNAKFGRIECHEAISAWGRETLLSASEVARDEGFELLHGIVDSLWVRRVVAGADVMGLGQRISREIGIPCEYQGRFKWIVFLPTRQWPATDSAPAVGALNRYYGCMDKAPDKPSRSQAGQPLDYIAGGAMKVRGVEIRQHSTSRIVREAQEAFLKVVAEADDARAFTAALPRAIDAVRPVWRRVLEGRAKLDDLVITNTVSQDHSQYRSMTCAAAALKQLAARGLIVQPGDCVRYVILDASQRVDRTRPAGRVRVDEASKVPHEKVVEARLMSGEEQYDAAAYERLLLRAVASLTLPFGIYEPQIQAQLAGRVQLPLAAFG